jgi:uncharacterized membrane protein YgcG
MSALTVIWGKNAEARDVQAFLATAKQIYEKIQNKQLDVTSEVCLCVCVSVCLCVLCFCLPFSHVPPQSSGIRLGPNSIQNESGGQGGKGGATGGGGGSAAGGAGGGCC